MKNLNNKILLQKSITTVYLDIAMTYLDNFSHNFSLNDYSKKLALHIYPNLIGWYTEKYYPGKINLVHVFKKYDHAYDFDNTKLLKKISSKGFNK